MAKKIRGAPLGGRVHLFLWSLNTYVMQNFHVRYRYSQKHYCLTRKTRKSFLYDSEVFIIVRTSEKCYRVSHFDYLSNCFTYCSFRGPRAAARYINEKAFEHEKLDNSLYLNDSDIQTSICVKPSWVSGDLKYKRLRRLKHDN